MSKLITRLLGVFAVLVLGLAGPAAWAQPLKEVPATTSFDLNYQEPKEYLLGRISVTGIEYLDPDALVAITGLKAGDRVTIPGEATATAIRKLWDQGLLSDVGINVRKVSGDTLYLELALKERPRLSRFAFKGIKKGEANDLREKVGLTRGRIVTETMIKNTSNIVRRFFISKGYYNAKVNIEQLKDSGFKNTTTLRINVDKGSKVKITRIEVEGNEQISDDKVRKRLKDTKQVNPWRIFKASRFVQAKFDKDKESLIAWYLKEGYRDASIVSDSVYRVDDRHVGIKLRIEEGRKYYFRNIAWTGNYLYTSKILGDVLGIKRGDIYNQEVLEKKTNFNPNGADVSSLYMDDGYLFFRVTPTEVNVEGDSIDVEMRVYEGQQATVNKIIVEGNTKTSDHVILREIRTLPGEKFSREKLIRTQRELSSLGYFDPEQLGIQPLPNPANGTVDIKYTVAEKPSDQVQLSGGWGGFYGFVGTLGLVFNNFSIRKAGQLSNWKPLPSGDGQRLSINFQANGRAFQTYSLSFSEPWLGGKKPNNLTVALSRSVNNIYSSSTSTEVIRALNLSSVTVSLGRRLRWPDDYFVLSNSVRYQNYNLFNYPISSDIPITDGTLNQLSFDFSLSRNSLSEPIFPRSGSSFTLSVQGTPPWSAFRGGRGYANASDKFRLVEFHKWMFDGSWFTSLAKNLVLNTRAHFGFLGYYDKSVGIGPFERFKMGGSGITGFNFLIGYDIIGLRGYQDNSIAPGGTNGAGIIYNKYVTELRYAITTSQAATIYVLGFLEGGNNVGSFRNFNPFNIYRSAGVGARIMMPAFGLLGLDYGVPLDGTPSIKNNLTFTIGQQIR